MKRIYSGICIAILAGYIYAGLYPFEFFQRNQVAWLVDREGIELGDHSVVHSARPLDLREGAGAVSIELYIEARDEVYDRVRPLLSLYDGDLPENLIIGQWKSRTVLRAAFLNARGRRRFREIDVKSGMRPGVRSLLAVTSGVGGTAIYVDGVLELVDPKLTLRPGNLEGRLLLGDSSDGDHGWRGKVFGLALFERALSPAEIERHYRLFADARARELQTAPGLAGLYLFDEGAGPVAADRAAAGNALDFPEYARPVHPVILRPPWRDSIHALDIIVNILGFVPFGLFYFLYRQAAHPGRALGNFLWALLAAAAISGTIELLQVYLPSRSSSMTDLICNIGGALVGILIALALRMRKSRVQDAEKRP